jgi:hypothetical protein
MIPWIIPIGKMKAPISRRIHALTEIQATTWVIHAAKGTKITTSKNRKASTSMSGFSCDFILFLYSKNAVVSIGKFLIYKPVCRNWQTVLKDFSFLSPLPPKYSLETSPSRERVSKRAEAITYPLDNSTRFFRFLATLPILWGAFNSDRILKNAKQSES